MGGITATSLELKDAFLIETIYSEDSRGSFCKTFEENLYKEAGISFHVTESFVSRSRKNVIRGLHFQTENPQAKLVSVLYGRVWDVIVDLRKNSETYKKWYSCELSADNHLCFYIPKGFAHGFVSLADGSVMLYQCDGAYNSRTDTGIIYNDPDLAIEWPIDLALSVHSERDLKLQTIEEFERVNEL